jgi:hypothetical protein
MLCPKCKTLLERAFIKNSTVLVNSGYKNEYKCYKCGCEFTVTILVKEKKEDEHACRL